MKCSVTLFNKKMNPIRTMSFQRPSRTSDGHTVTIQYIAEITSAGICNWQC